MDQLLNIKKPTTEEQIAFVRELLTAPVRVVKTSETMNMLKAIEENLVAVQLWNQAQAHVGTALISEPLALPGVNLFPNKGKINVYTCEEAKHQTVTIDREQGVTSFIISCPQCESNGVESEAYSAMYNAPQSLVPTHEFYQPTEEELSDLSADMAKHTFANLLDHVRQGGLLFRKIQEVSHA